MERISRQGGARRGFSEGIGGEFGYKRQDMVSAVIGPFSCVLMFIDLVFGIRGTLKPRKLWGCACLSASQASPVQKTVATTRFKNTLFFSPTPTCRSRELSASTFPNNP
eukprot:1328296-Amorphochlora_amoeboformis.AAC.1